MLGAEFDDRIAIRPNRLPIGLALFGLQYNPCPFWHAHDDLPLRRFPAKFLASRLSGQSVFTVFRVPMPRALRPGGDGGFEKLPAWRRPRGLGRTDADINEVGGFEYDFRAIALQRADMRRCRENHRAPRGP